jgi:polyhydroxybutyrate depolymerase
VPDGEVTGLPLIVVLHGFGGSGAQAREVSGVEAAAQARGLRAVFAFPDGTGDDGFPRSWNAGGCCPFANLDDVDDVGYLAALIADLTRDRALDARRVLVAGHSNGGMMAYRLACERPDLVRAVVVGAGALVAPSCTPSAAVTVLHLHGALDDVVPLAGGATSGMTFPSAERSAGDYARAAGCEGTVPEWTCPGGASVTLVVDPTWTHDWQPAWTERALDLLASLAPTG